MACPWSFERCEGMLCRGPARGEEGGHVLLRDVFDARALPARRVVLVDEEGADTLDDIALVEAGEHEVELHAEAVREGEPGAAPDLLVGHAEQRGRAFRERLDRRRGPRRIARIVLGTKRFDDRRDAALGEMAVDRFAKLGELALRIVDFERGYVREAAVERVGSADGG